MDLQTIALIVSVTGGSLTIFGVPFMIYTVYNRNRSTDNKEQDKIDKNLAITGKEVDGKAALLAQQVQWEKELNEKRFTEMGVRIDRALTLAENHTHTVDVKVDALKEDVKKMGLSIEKLATIIDERVPKKIM